MCTTCGCDNYDKHSPEYSRHMTTSQTAHPGSQQQNKGKKTSVPGTAGWLKKERK